MDPIIIIGTGLAGYTTARELRKLDKDIPLMLITGDSGGFYSKPMLSNAFAQNKSAQQLQSQSAAQMAGQLSATILQSTRVTNINAVTRTVATSAGSFKYSKLVIAKGAQPIRLPLSGGAADRVLSVNHLDDYALLRERLSTASRVVILGAGLIGCEFADDLAGAGHSVTLVDPNPQPLAALAAPALSLALRAALEQRGVRLETGTTATHVEYEGEALRITLANAKNVAADVVLSAVGLRANLTLAQLAGLHTGRGILIDEYGRTSNEHIYALGDCAEYKLPGDAGSLTMPYIAPLMSAARAIARTLAGQPTTIDLKSAPVIVKTPSYPLALMPPLPHQVKDGSWVSENDGQTIIARFYDAAGVMTGFGVAPQAAAIRQALMAELGSMRAPMASAA